MSKRRDKALRSSSLIALRGTSKLVNELYVRTGEARRLVVGKSFDRHAVDSSRALLPAKRLDGLGLLLHRYEETLEIDSRECEAENQ